MSGNPPVRRPNACLPNCRRQRVQRMTKTQMLKLSTGSK